MMYDASRTERMHLAIQNEAPPISLRPKQCACGKKITAKLLAQHGKCDVCRLTAPLEPGDLEKLQHMLGATARYSKSKWGWRNYYLCGRQDRSAMDRMVAAGLMLQGRALLGEIYYHATIDGCRAAGLNAPAIRRAMGGEP